MRMLTTLIRADLRHGDRRRASTSSPNPATGPAAHRLRRAGQRRGPQPARRRRADIQGLIYGLDRRVGQAADGELLEALDLTALAPAQGVRACPAGSAAGSTSPSAWCTRRQLLFLDEPSTGLDPQNRANLWEHILRLRDRSTTMTIVLTTHYLDEADTMAERVVVVDHGEVIADDTAEALKADARRRPGRADGRPPAGPQRRAGDARRGAAAAPGT